MMATFKAYFKKEIIESARQYRYIILSVGIILFAILDPIMLKALPLLMKGQLPVDLSSIMVITPKSAATNYIKDLFQIGCLFVVFTMGGILCDEIRSQKLLFPYSMGSSTAGIVLAKVLHYTLTIVLLIFIGFPVNYYYGSILFEGQTIGFTEVLTSAVLMSVFFFFNITLVTFLSSIVKKGITAGFIAIVIDYTAIPLSSIKKICKFIPYTLIQGANTFTFDNMILTIIFTISLSLLLTILTINNMNKVEII